MFSGSYPLGADTIYAPWNEREPDRQKCEECNGNGYHYYAYNFEKDEETPCTKETWLCLPETEEEAIAKHQHYVQGGKETCNTCNGFGELDVEPDDYEPYYGD